MIITCKYQKVGAKIVPLAQYWLCSLWRSILADPQLIYLFQLIFAKDISKTIPSIFLRYVHHINLPSHLHIIQTEMIKWVEGQLNCSLANHGVKFHQTTLYIHFATFLRGNYPKKGDKSILMQNGTPLKLV